MTRTYRPRARRTTQPILVQRPRDPAIERLGFTCFRLVDSGGQLWPIELVTSRAQMFVFTRG
ncbi:MAG: hypothetical protein SFX73_03135 [Kofleriaceae bacterium]|nr:hypothetical protein [Kofleriaceae bacterium]